MTGRGPAPRWWRCAWADRIDEFFGQARLPALDGAGHFAPLEQPGVIAEAEEVGAFLG